MRFLSIFFLLGSYFAEAACDSSFRKVTGNEPLASKLYEATKAIPYGSWEDGSFGMETFEYLGSVSINRNAVYVTYLHTTWGPTYCHRATKRLIFFNSAFKEVGQYYGVQKPRLQGNNLVFPEGEIGASMVDVSNGLPEELNDGNDYHSISIY